MARDIISLAFPVRVANDTRHRPRLFRVFKKASPKPESSWKSIKRYVLTSLSVSGRRNRFGFTVEGRCLGHQDGTTRVFREVMSTAASRTSLERPADPIPLARMTAGVLPGIQISAPAVPPGEDFNGAGGRASIRTACRSTAHQHHEQLDHHHRHAAHMVEAVQERGQGKEVEIQTGTTYTAQYAILHGRPLSHGRKGRPIKSTEP